MGKATRRDRRVPQPAGKRLPPRPPVRVAGGTEELGPRREPRHPTEQGRLSQDHVGQIEKGITWPTVRALQKVAAALKRSVPVGKSHLDSEGPS